ncbi:MAG: LuxR C-terminal-related transcriptional regulator [Pseudonocardia sp.]
MTRPAATPVRVVVADRHPVWREGLRATLARHIGLRVVGEAGCAADALAVVTRVRPDAVLLDPALPAAGRPAGLQVCRDLRSRCPDSRVLVLGPGLDERAAANAVEAGASGYLGRDAGVAELVDAVRAVAAGRRVLDRRVPVTSGERLTGRQLEVLRLLARGLSNRDIAGALTVSEGTVKFHLAKIMRRLDVPGRAAAVYTASRQGLI